MLAALVNQEFVMPLNVDSHSQTLVEPDTVAGWAKIPLTSPALTQIHNTIATETGSKRIAFQRNSFLPNVSQRIYFLASI